MSFTRTALLVAAGPIAWAAHFLTIYGFTGIACARAGAASVPLAVVLATVVAASACLVVIMLARKREGFEPRLATGLAAAALLAILWEAFPVWLVPPCA